MTWHYKGAISTKFAIKLNKRFTNLPPVCKKQNIERLAFLNIIATVTVYQTAKHASLNTLQFPSCQKKVLKVLHKFHLVLHENLLLLTQVYFPVFFHLN